MPLTPDLAARAQEFTPSWGPAPVAQVPQSGWGAGGKTLAERLAEKDAAAAEGRARAEAAAAEAAAAAAASAAAQAVAAQAAEAAAAKAAAAQAAAAQAAAAQAAAAETAAAEAAAGAAAEAKAIGARKDKEADAVQNEASEKKKKNKGKKAKSKVAEPVNAAASAFAPPSGAPVAEQGKEHSGSEERRWGVQLDVLAKQEGLADDMEKKTRRNLRGFPESPLRARPAALLRQNSDVDLSDYLSKRESWRQRPSVVTWLLHKPAALEGFAAFCAAAEVQQTAAAEESPTAAARPPVASMPTPTLDDFDLLRLVGAGGFGKVYQVRKKSSGRIMALKAMRKHLVISELNVEGTRNERSVLEQIQHPFIVRLHCAFHDSGRLYLLMDWHNGGHFLRLLQEKSPFNEHETRFYLAELVLAIEGLHSHGIVHRDLKPENVLVDCLGHLVVTDFGASKIAVEHEEEDGDIRTNSWVGTEMYMAPEQLQVRQNSPTALIKVTYINHKSDLYQPSKSLCRPYKSSMAPGRRPLTKDATGARPRPRCRLVVSKSLCRPYKSSMATSNKRRCRGSSTAASSTGGRLGYSHIYVYTYTYSQERRCRGSSTAASSTGGRLGCLPTRCSRATTPSTTKIPSRWHSRCRRRS